MVHGDLGSPQNSPSMPVGTMAASLLQVRKKEAQRLSDLLKIAVLVRSVSGSGAHALEL